MLLIAKRTAIGAALLLVMPVIVWLSGWQWQPGQAPAMLKMWYWVTETVTQPWGIMTHVALFGWFFCGVYDFVCAKRWCCFSFSAPLSRQDRGLNPGSKNGCRNHGRL